MKTSFNEGFFLEEHISYQPRHLQTYKRKEWHFDFQKLLTQNFNLNLTAELLIQGMLHLCINISCISIKCADRNIYSFI